MAAAPLVPVLILARDAPAYLAELGELAPALELRAHTSAEAARAAYAASEACRSPSSLGASATWPVQKIAGIANSWSTALVS